MFQRSLLQLVVLMLLLLPTTGASACEYCVREVGFVSLYHEPYRVVIAVAEWTDDAERDRVLAQARAAIGPGNVVVSIGSAEDGGEYADVVDRAGDHLPAAVVYAPDGRNELLALSPDGDRRGLITTVDELTHSPAREGLGAALIDGYATVLVVEGTDADANRAARELAEAAIQRINAVKSGFDRVIEIGPALRVITAAERSDERWLLWSLGITDGGEAMPSVAVLYGKGRRLGDVLTGSELTDHALFTMLSVVARDCECDLDRGWLYSNTIPLVWDDALRRRAYDSLGFDPESAATRAAVARILERGPGSSGANVRDPFLEDSGTNIGIPGLTIYNLNDEASSVPPAVVASATQRNASDSPDDTGHANSTAASNASADTVPPPASIVGASPMWMTLFALGGLALLVLIAGGVLIAKSRGNH
ncbi:hypothetical protein OT109_08195 [Phycisphaeraceae bacterium D3-23]